jgi:hypothetical protein
MKDIFTSTLETFKNKKNLFAFDVRIFISL